MDVHQYRAEQKSWRPTPAQSQPSVLSAGLGELLIWFKDLSIGIPQGRLPGGTLGQSETPHIVNWFFSESLS